MIVGNQKLLGSDNDELKWEFIVVRRSVVSDDDDVRAAFGQSVSGALDAR